LDKNLVKLQERTGYVFKDGHLLVLALTHSSYANESGQRKGQDNERLEYLGDAVLELVVSEFIYNIGENMSEGDMSKNRARIVCEESLAYYAERLDIGRCLFLGRGEDLSGGRKRSSVLSDALEAVIGAVYLDGGLASVREFVKKNILEDVRDEQLFYDYKTMLQELVQLRFYKKRLYYDLIWEKGPDHDRDFMVVAMLEDEQLGEGIGKSKKAAEQRAAYNSLVKLKNE